MGRAGQAVRAAPRPRSRPLRGRSRRGGRGRSRTTRRAEPDQAAAARLRWRSLVLALLLGAASAVHAAGAHPGQQLPHRRGLQPGARRRPAHQHVLAPAGSGDWLYTFTQEWPLPDQKHQLSFTLPVQELHAAGRGEHGHRRRGPQLSLPGARDRRAARSPSRRASACSCPRAAADGLGTGGVGLQFNLPLSWQLGSRFVTHWNAGATRTPPVRATRRATKRAPTPTPWARAWSGWPDRRSTFSWRRSGSAPQRSRAPGAPSKQRRLLGQPGSPLGPRLRERPADRPRASRSPSASVRAAAQHVALPVPELRASVPHPPPLTATRHFEI